MHRYGIFRVTGPNPSAPRAVNLIYEILGNRLPTAGTHREDARVDQPLTSRAWTCRGSMLRNLCHVAPGHLVVPFPLVYAKPFASRGLTIRPNCTGTVGVGTFLCQRRGNSRPSRRVLSCGPILPVVEACRLFVLAPVARRVICRSAVRAEPKRLVTHVEEHVLRVLGPTLWYGAASITRLDRHGASSPRRGNACTSRRYRMDTDHFDPPSS